MSPAQRLRRAEATYNEFVTGLIEPAYHCEIGFDERKKEMNTCHVSRADMDAAFKSRYPDEAALAELISPHCEYKGIFIVVQRRWDELKESA